MNLSSWKKGRVDEFFVLQRGFDITEAASREGSIPVISSSGFSYFHSESKVPGPGVVTGRKGRVGPVYYIEEDHWPHDTTLWVKDFKGNLPKYVYYFLQSIKLERYNEALAVPTLNRNNVHAIRCIFPPLKEQEKIVNAFSLWDNAIEKTEALIAAKEKQFEWLCNELITLSDKETYLSELCTIKTGKKDVNEGATNGKYPFFTCAKEPMLSNSYSFDTTAILIAGNGNIGNPRLYSGKFEAYQRTYVLFDFKNVDPRFLIFFLRLKLQRKIDKERQQGAMPYIKLNTLTRFKVSLPELEVQKKVADQLDTAQLEIKLTRKLLQQYRSQKRGLMQKLLTGEWQVSSAQPAAEGALQGFSKENVA